jgi:uncharacterized protein (DUF2147 family)
MIRIAAFLSAAFTACAMLAAPLAAASTGPSPVGLWQTTTGESRYRVVSCGKAGEICAKLIWLRDDARTAENLRYLDTYVVKGAVPVDANRWKGTVYYDGQQIGGSMTMVADDHMRLTGCRLVCRTLEFTRV